MSELVRLRVRGAPEPRPATARAPRRPPRRAVFLHVQAEEDEQLSRAVAVELLDGHPVATVVVPRPGEEGIAQAWAERAAVPSPSGVIAPVVLDAGQLGRFVGRRCWHRAAGLIALDLPWSIGRLAADVRGAKGGGMSVGLAGCGWWHRVTGRWMDSHFHARVRISARGGEEGGAFLGWVPSRRRRRTRRRLGGPFLGLKVLGAALGADTSSARALSRSYGIAWPERPDPLDQLTAEALALVECERLMLAELAEVAPGLAPENCWSGGSIVTHALRLARVRAPIETTATLPPEAIGGPASASHGGRTEALLVGCALPMALADLKATYPALLALLGLASHLAAHRFEMVDVSPDEVTRLLDPIGLRDRLHDRGWWREIGTLFAEVEARGELLPSQRQADDRWRSVTAPLDLGGGTIVLHGSDLVRPALAGRLPATVRAFRVASLGVAEGLGPVRLPSGRAVDLTEGDFGRALIEERRLAEAIEDPVLRARRVNLAKGLAVSGAWGVFGRVDRLDRPRPVEVVATGTDGKERRRRRTPKRVEVVGFGPHGEALRVMTQRPDQAGPLTLWHLAAAIPAACRAVMAMVAHDVEAAGGSIAAVMTDAVAVPAAPVPRLQACSGGPHRLPDGREAVRLLGFDELERILGRFDRLLHPEGGAAFKEEAGSLSGGTIGLVVGVNKVLLGRQEGADLFLVRSSDTGIGDHFLDPTGQDGHLDDGRTRWSADLEELLLVEVLGSGPDEPLRVPSSLPAWADDRPAFRPGRATTLDELRHLRLDLGDDSVGPFASYVRVGGRDGPACLGVSRDPATWRCWPWRRHGRPCQPAILDGDGRLDAAAGEGPLREVPTMRDVLRRWVQERDPTVGGPKRGLRHVLPVRSHPALVEVVGRGGEAAGQGAGDDPLVYGTFLAKVLLDEARLLGAAEVAQRSGLSERTARAVLSGAETASSPTVALLAAAVSQGAAERKCAGCGTVIGAGGRSDRRWCGDACRKAAKRAQQQRANAEAATDPLHAPADEARVRRTIELLATTPGLPPGRLGLTVLGSSPRLPGAVAACLAAGATPEVILDRVAADGSVKGRSPVGVLVSRLLRLAPALAAECQGQEASSREGARLWGERLAGLVLIAELPDAATGRSVIEEEPNPALRAVALDAFSAACLVGSDS